MSLKWAGSQLVSNGSLPAPTISTAVPLSTALALRRTEGSVTAERPRRRSRRRFAFEDQIQLLLAARLFVVILDQQLVRTTRDEEVDSERVDAKCVLERVPRRVA
jgi:hypothetical protein